MHAEREDGEQNACDGYLVSLNPKDPWLINSDFCVSLGGSTLLVRGSGRKSKLQFRAKVLMWDLRLQFLLTHMVIFIPMEQLMEARVAVIGFSYPSCYWS